MRKACVLVGTLVLVASASLAASEPMPAGAASSTVSIPITTQTFNYSGDLASYVVVMARVAGGPSVPLELDTGSSGLTIFSSEVGSQAKATGVPYSVAYASGAVVGSLMTGSISLGRLSTPRATKFLSIPQGSHVATALKERYGVDGILGIATATGDAPGPWYSPLLQLPSPYRQGFTLRVAQSGTGSLTVGPVSTPSGASTVAMTRASPATYPGNVPAWDQGVQLCWAANGQTPACGSTLFDIGSPWASIDPISMPNLPKATPPIAVLPGTALSMSSSSGATVWSYSAGETPQSGLTFLLPTGSTPFVTGINFFFNRTVAYNISRGQIVVSP